MKPHNPLDEPRRQDDLLLYRLYRVYATAAPLVARICDREFGITRREWRVLSCLIDVEGVQSSELAERVMLDRARTSRTLTRLADKGLVRRAPRPSDRREVHVFLTDEGRRVHGEIFPRVEAIQRELLAPFEPAERVLLSDFLGRLQARAQHLNPPDGYQPLDVLADDS